MIHQLHLHPLPYQQIKSGLKTIESRLNDDKRRGFKIGDQIEIFKRPDNKESITVSIINLHFHQTFKDLFSSTLPQVFGGESEEELLESIFNYYSKEDEEKYGVVGIEFEKIAE